MNSVTVCSKLAALAAARVARCSAAAAASSGHAPGVAGGQTLTPGITNFPLAYVKRPRRPTTEADIDARDLITSITGGDLYMRAAGERGRRRSQRHRLITKGKGDVRDLDVSPDGTKLVFSLRLPLESEQAQHRRRPSRTGISISTTPTTQGGHAADQRQHHRRPRRRRPLPA